MELLNYRRELETKYGRYYYLSLKDLNKDAQAKILNLPYARRILLENLLRNFYMGSISKESLWSFVNNQDKECKNSEIPFYPSRIIMQDFSGLPALIDIATVSEKTGNKNISLSVNLDLVIDHSNRVDLCNDVFAKEKNIVNEFKRNRERFSFFKWAQNHFQNFRVFSPGKGIIHQINLECLTKVTATEMINGNNYIFPETVIGMDSHTTMINGCSVLGWGVGGIEAEAVLLGQPIFIMVPKIMGVELSGKLNNRASAFDLALTLTEKLREKNVIGHILEFFGTGVAYLNVSQRATVANMSPEYGATAAFFPADAEVLKFLRLTGRKKSALLLMDYLYAQDMLCDYVKRSKVDYERNIHIDLTKIRASIAGPFKPWERRDIDDLQQIKLDSQEKLVLASITSCTTTSEPYMIIAAAMLAKNAVERGLSINSEIKTSFSPGSLSVKSYLRKAGLLKYLEKLGFYITGFSCSTCVGSSGDLVEGVEEKQGKSKLCAVISGNRNYQGRIHPKLDSVYLTSPLYVVAFALSGRMDIDFSKHAIGIDRDKKEVFLMDIMPDMEEVKELVNKVISPDIYLDVRDKLFCETKSWKEIENSEDDFYNWNKKSTYIHPSPFISSSNISSSDIIKARALLVLGDNITTDHISPVGTIDYESSSGKYLTSLGIKEKDFNSYGTRRGNSEIMKRGAFDNKRLRNLLVNQYGAFTRKFPENRVMSVYDASISYKKENTPLIILAGKSYGAGSARDWAAKATKMLGVRAIIAGSFERIHCSNLVYMGILPLEFLNGDSMGTLKLTGGEIFNIRGIKKITPGSTLCVELIKENKRKEFMVKVRIDTNMELTYFKKGGFLPYFLNEKI